MHSRRRHAPAPASILLFCLALAVLFFPTVPAAGVRLDHGYNSYQHNANHGAFPFLSWLRDTAVEWIFGIPPNQRHHKTENLGAINPRFADETVIRFNVSTQDEANALADAADIWFLDVWAATKNFVDVKIHKDDLPPFLTLLPKSLRGNFSTLIHDLPAAVAATYEPRVRLSESDAAGKPDSTTPEFDNVFFHQYQPLEVIYQWMRLLESMFPRIVHLETIGKSFEGRDILALRIGSHLDAEDDTKKPKQTVVITGGLHAREWISTSTVTYLVWALISSYKHDSIMTRFLDNYTTVFIPVTNPDGYDYSWNGDRLWRKTRQETGLSFCTGVDLNHAFGFQWNKNVRQPCSEDYGGSKPFEAVEARELSEWAQKHVKYNNTKFVGFIDLHSYSQEILYPYEYTCDPEPPNVENLEELAADLAKAIRLSSGEQYDVFSACEGAVLRRYGTHGRVHTMEPPGGSAMDWFYHEMHAKYSFQIKLRDRGSYGFLLPAEYIIPTGQETFNALKFYADFILGNNGIESISGKPVLANQAVASVEQQEGEVRSEFEEDEAREILEMGELKRRRRKM